MSVGRVLDERDPHGLRTDVEVVHDRAEKLSEDLPVARDDAGAVVDQERGCRGVVLQ